MQVEITLAGYSSSWTFSGSRRFGAWAETKPWLNEGGLCVIRTEGPWLGDFLVPAVIRFLHGIHAGENVLDIRRIECGGQLGTPIQALMQAFELDPTIHAFEARDKIRARLLDRSFVAVFVESDSVSPDEWEALVNLLEHYRKSKNPVPICAIIIDPRGIVNAAPVCDYLNGRATHHILSDAATDGEAALWSAYLHHRAVWEGGGSPTYAISLSSELEQAKNGDDEGVEARLQAHADAYLSRQPGVDALRELIGIGQGIARVEPARARALRAEMQAKMLLWRPPGMNSLHLAPWVSRALLAMPGVPRQQVWSLRHHLVCAPLAAEILALCLQFESQIQTKLHERKDRNKVSASTIENHRRFKDGGDNFVVYPNAFPARPTCDDDVWAFASLGEALKSCPQGTIQTYWDTLNLRNAIAHGHYVGWHHVRRALGLLRYFDTPGMG